MQDRCWVSRRHQGLNELRPMLEKIKWFLFCSDFSWACISVWYSQCPLPRRSTARYVFHKEVAAALFLTWVLLKFFDVSKFLYWIRIIYSLFILFPTWGFFFFWCVISGASLMHLFHLYVLSVLSENFRGRFVCCNHSMPLVIFAAFHRVSVF